MAADGWYETVNAFLGCHDLTLSCCHEIARISVREYPKVCVNLQTDVR